MERIMMHSGTCDETEKVTCGACLRSWCDYHDGTPGPLCPWCHGRGYSVAPWHTSDAISAGKRHATHMAELTKRLERI